MNDVAPIADGAAAAEAQAAAAARPLAFAELAAVRQHRLPRDHPSHPADSIVLTARARQHAARGRPAVIRAATFWDHRVRSAAIGARRLTIDPSGSYKID